VADDPEKLKFDREKAAFDHNAAQMRALNDQMGKVPALAVTITGGLWFAASQVRDIDPAIKFGLLIFAGFINLALVIACIRIRDVLQSYLEKIEDFAPGHFANGKPKRPLLTKLGAYSMIGIYCAIMVVAATMSFVGAMFFYWPFHVNYWWFGAIAIILPAFFVIFGPFKRTIQ
jgi:hypothetical protein